MSQSEEYEEEKEGVNPSVYEHAARSFRAMTMLKQDISISSGPAVLIKSSTQAGLLAKDLLFGLSNASMGNRYSTFHIRELLDALLEAFPEKVLSAAAAGGKQCVQDHFGPLLTTDQTLSILCHLVCYGCTGRKGIASAEKSTQHTAMYPHLHNASKSKISLGQRRKFVKAMADFHLMEALVQCLTSTSGDSLSSNVPTANELGEEVCETILTILEVVGYPPGEPPPQMQNQAVDKQKEDAMVGEDVLLSPLASSNWWQTLFETLQRPDCSIEQMEAIARTCTQVFALATGNSSRVCKSHAPATDATEQTSEEIVEEKEVNGANRLTAWGLTDKMHEALLTQLPLLVSVLNLPTQDILDHQATTSTNPPIEGDVNSLEENIRHPGRYQTKPLGSWRLQLLSLLKEIIIYRSRKSATEKLSMASANLPRNALDLIMELPVPPEILKSKREKKNPTSENDTETSIAPIYNPWPALCSFVWAYPNNDFYHIIFFQMLKSVVLEHHEATLRLILQKSKFLTRAVRSLSTAGALQGALINSLNLLHLRSQSLPPSAFLPQYLGSHDGWKDKKDELKQ